MSKGKYEENDGKIAVNPDDFKIMDYSSITVQRIINRNIRRAYYLMIGNGGYYKTEFDIIENLRFNIEYQEFRDEAKLESSLIYVEASNSYNPNHADRNGKTDVKIKFVTWLYWKLRDLDGRMWRLFATGSKKLDVYVDTGKSNSFEAEFIFRDSLSTNAQEILTMLETGIGFKLKKSTEYDKSNCHIGIQNFWETFIRDDIGKKFTYREFLSIWNEIRKGYHEIETDNMIYTVIDADIA